MANEATATDQYVRREIEKFGVRYDEQGSSHPEIAKALKGASKQARKIWSRETRVCAASF